MLDLERILKQDRLLHALNGLNRKAFDDLLPSFAQAYWDSLNSPEKPRQRASGGGRKATFENHGGQVVLQLVLLQVLSYVRSRQRLVSL
jgi:hypothetical protein